MGAFKPDREDSPLPPGRLRAMTAAGLPPTQSPEIAMSPLHRKFARYAALCLAVWPLAAPNAASAQAFMARGPAPGNVFISPCGRPFRAKADAPYPVVDWFKLADANGDGKIDHAEFIADTLAFFKLLDRNSDDVISPQEMAFYEQRIAPEVLGMQVEIGGDAPSEAQALLWRVQGIPGGQGPGGGGTYRPGGATGPGTTVDPGAGNDSGPDSEPRQQPYDASGAGASPYSFFDEPEPVAAADINFRGLIPKADFLKLAEIHFATLDSDHRGYLTLDSLPTTPVQRRLEHGRRRSR